LSELDTQPQSTEKADQEPLNVPAPVAPEDEPGNLEIAHAARAAWDSATEQEWNEHSATSWALAHVIHHIRSTPLPPFLSSEQQRHFQKIIQMAAALIEDWQRRERDQAQRLALGRPVTELPTEPAAADEQPAAASQDTFSESRAANRQARDEASQNHKI
jgi:hypothetical protein